MPNQPALPILFILIVSIFGCKQNAKIPALDEQQLARKYFDSDTAWFLKNIPFFECSDRQLEEVYYYRWKMYKAHIREVSDSGYVITEFINHAGWDRDPWCTINAASMHHIYEGRWLRHSAHINSYIDYLYQGGGNNRSYSESIADATFANFLVNADTRFLLRQLDTMIAVYNAWSDHYDSTKSLYYIPAMPDATEFTIASIDASGGKDGFEGGDAFRPTINSYMCANAQSISAIADIKGDTVVRNKFANIATELRSNINQQLWNDSLQHFCDRFKVNNKFVKYWDFIRGRELAGMIPWYFNVPEDSAKYNVAWKHAIDTSQLLGQFGYRTNEPSYEYYFHQFIFFEGQRGSQWNGPSWPYQSSMVLTGMANFINNYHQDIINNGDYLHALKLFAAQHYLPDGKINLVENYDPNLGGPIVYYYWSNHYNHSSFNNLIITGLCGIRPSASDTLTINPLINDSIKYFALQDVNYHGHKLTVIYDREGTKYNLGMGLRVFVDGKNSSIQAEGHRYKVFIGSPVPANAESLHPNIALNISKANFPAPSASVNTHKDSLFQAIDGRQWYFPEVRNWWSTWGSVNNEDWYALDFGKQLEISEVDIYPLDEGKFYSAPTAFSVQYFKDGNWLPVSILQQQPSKPAGNQINTIRFEKIRSSKMRVVFSHSDKVVALTEIRFR